MARTFGYFDTLSVVAWIIAVCLSLFLVDRFAIHQLLLLIAPAALMAFIIIWFLPSDRKAKRSRRPGFNWLPYQEVLKEIGRWPTRLRTLILSSFLISFVSAAFFFYIPIEVWKTGSDLKQVIILAIFFGLPEALGNPLGWLVNKLGVGRSLIISFIGTALVISSTIFWSSFLWRLAAVTLVGIFIEIISLSRRQLISDINTKPGSLGKIPWGFGKINAVLGEVISLGGMLGVVVIGILINFIGWAAALIFLTLVIISVFVLFLKKGLIRKTAPNL